MSDEWLAGERRTILFECYCRWAALPLAGARFQQVGFRVEEEIRNLMSLATGCISIAMDPTVQVVVERVMEYFIPNPETRNCDVFVDIFLENRTETQQSFLILHRGGVSAEDLTSQSWLPRRCEVGWPAILTSRVVKLHESTDHIEISDQGVRVADRNYQPQPCHVNPLVGGNAYASVPFSMWMIDGFQPMRRSVCRLHLKFSGPSYEAQIGKDDTFYAYGEAVLLDKIANEDLPCYDGPDKAKYYTEFDNFVAAKHEVPEIFEYLVVCDDNSVLEWETTPLSPMLYEQPILELPLARNTQWFIIDHKLTNGWSLIGKRYGGFLLKLHAVRSRAIRNTPELVLG